MAWELYHSTVYGRDGEGDRVNGTVREGDLLTQARL